MPDTLSNLWHGFAIALTWENFLYSWAGAALGTLVGVLPGFGPVTAMALLLPLTFKMSATGAVIMLAGIYYGANHAGSTTAIMLNMPAEPASIVICFDGYPLALMGRAGPALCMAALSSFFAGCICIIVIAFFSPLLGEAALQFGAPEYTSAIILALSSVSVLSRKSIINTMGMAILGLILGTVGTDINSGAIRFTAGEIHLQQGISFVPVSLALFVLVHIVFTLSSAEPKMMVKTRFRDLAPNWTDIKRCFMPVLRGTAIGGALGVLPGTGAFIASFASYAVEIKSSRTPERFGKGAIEGVAAPEAAANASAFTHFIPMLSLGLPSGTAMALMLGALIIQGIAPGPQLISQHPDLFWGLVASMWIGNLMLLVLNLPLVGVWIRLLQTPYRLIYPVIVVFCMVGIYTGRGEPFDVMLAAVVLVVGWVLERLDCGPGPLILGIILGPLLEENMRRAMTLSHGDATVFFTHPISLAFLILAAIVVVVFTLPAITKREKTAVEAAGIEPE
jgi:putative tricarboxylic transport membrane protein